MNLFPNDSVFDEIRSTRVASTKNLHAGCIDWLHRHHLTMSNPQIHVPASAPPVEHATVKQCLRAGPGEKQRIRREWNEHNASKIDANQVWNEYRNLKTLRTVLDVERINPDCMAFYLAFHFEPTCEWGVYISANELLAYGESLNEALREQSVVFPRDVLFALVLFEVFNHEFFHHIVESAATTLEILSAVHGQPTKIYLDYLDHYKYIQAKGVAHPHHPLEEALANAYAYNSLSFISRVKLEFRTIAVILYQSVLSNSWRQDPPGYRDAGSYIGDQSGSGAAQFLSMLTDCGHLDPSSALLISRGVLLNGHSAFYEKSEIPTYLYGTDDAIAELSALVPAPMETYTGLFWPRDTTEVDKIIRERSEAEKKRKRQGQLSPEETLLNGLE